MKQILAIFLSTFLCVAAGAQVIGTSTVPPKEAVAVEEALGISETSFDFGKIPQGKPVIHVFEVTNLGKDSLKISNVQASCGCTTPEWERDKIHAPGAKSKITVGYNAAAEGPFTKSITISYNGTLSKQITISGEVWKTPASSVPENSGIKALKSDETIL